MSEEKRGMLSAGRPSNVRKSATLASLSDKGGILKARQLFDPRFAATLDELQTALVA